MQLARWYVACVATITLLSGCGGGSDPAGTAALERRGASRPTTDSVSVSPVPTTTGTTTTGTASALAAVTTVPEGRLLASNCFQCHGTNGVSTGGFDSLAGESVSELVEELAEMKTKGEDDKAIMRPHALGYTDQQILSLARYFASQTAR